MREPIVLACEALRGGRALNMGQCVDLFDLVANADEATAMATAYADYLETAKAMARADAEDLARRNIMTGLSYMSRDDALDIFTAALAPTAPLTAKEKK